jgi:hypothetical protein
VAEPTYNIELASIYGAKTKQGLVEMTISVVDEDRRGLKGILPGSAPPIKIQMDIPKAKHVLEMMATAIEAAISDGLLVRFLTEKVGLPEEAAARALLDFREMRQGSRETVNPN